MNHVLERVHSGATWWIQWIEVCGTSMQAVAIISVATYSVLNTMTLVVSSCVIVQLQHQLQSRVKPRTSLASQHDTAHVRCYDATVSPSLIAFTRRLNTMLFSHSLHLWQSDSRSYPAWSCRRLYFFPVVKCSWRFFWLHGTRILILVYNNNNNNAGTDKQTDGWQKHGPYCTYHVSIVNYASLPINHSAQQTLYVILATQQIQPDQFPQDIHDMHF